MPTWMTGQLGEEQLRKIDVGPIFPPYQTDSFQKCSLLWDLGKRWRKKEDKPRVAMLIGTAVALGLESHYKTDGQDPFEVAAVYAERAYQEGSDKSLKGTLSLVRRGMELGVGTNLGLTEIMAVEEYIGRVKPDLIGRAYDGELVVIDHKVKSNLEDRWLDKELEGYDTSNQLFQYAWQVGQEYGEPVVTCIIHMIILGPVPRTILHPVRITQEHLNLWLHGVALDWRQMDTIEKGTVEAGARFASCMGKYGKCDMYTICHTLEGDEGVAHPFYDQLRERR